MKLHLHIFVVIKSKLNFNYHHPKISYIPRWLSAIYIDRYETIVSITEIFMTYLCNVKLILTTLTYVLLL